MFSVTLAVATIPEGLAAVVIVAFSIGLQRIAQRKALVRKLNAVEALGSVSLIATDKTGRLTENRMNAQEIDSPYSERALLAMVIANNAEDDAAFGDSVDVAFIGIRAHKGNSWSCSFCFLPSTDAGPAITQTAVFLHEAVAQLLFAYPVRHLHARPLPDVWLHIAVWGGTLLQLVIVAFEPARHFLGLDGLSTKSLVIIARGFAMSWSVAEIESTTHGVTFRMGV